MIPFVREFAFKYGRADRVSPMIRRVVAENPGPFTFTGTGAHIVGRGEVAVVDPGPDDPRQIEAILKATAGERISHIFVTHSHLDHSPAARPLAERTGAVIHAGAAQSRPSGGGDRLEAGDDLGFRPDVMLSDGQYFHGPGWTIEAVATPGHTSNHFAFALIEENALFPGDHIMGWSTTVVIPPDGDMDAYLDSLERVRQGGYATLWPTHGPPVTDVAPFLIAYQDHRLAREAQIVARLEAGDRTIAEMVPVLYAAVDRRLWPAASLSVLAHLIRLARHGIVAWTPSGDGDLPGPTSVFTLR